MIMRFEFMCSLMLALYLQRWKTYKHVMLCNYDLQTMKRVQHIYISSWTEGDMYLAYHKTHDTLWQYRERLQVISSHLIIEHNWYVKETLQFTSNVRRLYAFVSWVRKKMHPNTTADIRFETLYACAWFNSRDRDRDGMQWILLSDSVPYRSQLVLI